MRRREVADDEDRRVARVLELPELAQDHRVAEREVGAAGVDAELHPERAARAASFSSSPPSGTISTAPLRSVDQVVGAHVRADATSAFYRVPAGPPGGMLGHRDEDRRALPLGRRARGARLDRPRRAACRELDDYHTRPLAQTTFLYAADGSPDHEPSTPARTGWCCRYGQMPQSIRDAAVAIEDRRFYWHHGVDLQRHRPRRRTTTPPPARSSRAAPRSPSSW